MSGASNARYRSIPRGSILDAFGELVCVGYGGGCWMWLGSMNLGYGQRWVDGRNEYAHRLSYEMSVGAAPRNMHIHHTCENKGCVNPDHIVMLTPMEHRHEHTPKFCVRGHPFTPENRYTIGPRHTTCLICKRERDRRYYAERKKNAHE